MSLTNFIFYKERIRNEELNSYPKNSGSVIYSEPIPSSYEYLQQSNNHSQEEIDSPILTNGDKLPLSMLLCLLADGRQLTLEEIDRVLVFNRNENIRKEKPMMRVRCIVHHENKEFFHFWIEAITDEIKDTTEAIKLKAMLGLSTTSLIKDRRDRTKTRQRIIETLDIHLQYVREAKEN